MKAIPNYKTQAEVKKAFETIGNCEYKNAKGLYNFIFIFISYII